MVKLMKRNQTRSVKVGNLVLGGNENVYIQSMTTTKTKDINKLKQDVAVMKEHHEADINILKGHYKNIKEVN